jgi:hypothetical protein
MAANDNQKKKRSYTVKKVKDAFTPRKTRKGLSGVFARLRSLATPSRISLRNFKREHVGLLDAHSTMIKETAEYDGGLALEQKGLYRESASNRCLYVQDKDNGHVSYSLSTFSKKNKTVIRVGKLDSAGILEVGELSMDDLAEGLKHLDLDPSEENIQAKKGGANVVFEVLSNVILSENENSLRNITDDSLLLEEIKSTFKKYGIRFIDDGPREAFYDHFIQLSAYKDIKAAEQMKEKFTDSSGELSEESGTEMDVAYFTRLHEEMIKLSKAPKASPEPNVKTRTKSTAGVNVSALREKFEKKKKGEQKNSPSSSKRPSRR